MSSFTAGHRRAARGISSPRARNGRRMILSRSKRPLEWSSCAMNAATKASATTNRRQPVDKKTILIVEDEPPLLALLKQILEDAGYRVFMAKDGLEARDVYRREQDAIDLVLSDMAKDGLEARDVYRRE